MMPASRENTFSVTIQRRDSRTSWGISIVGGADQGAPIVITKVLPGSPCDKKLKEGDEIRKIEDYDARDLTHQNVHHLFEAAQTSIKLVVKRNNAFKAFGSFNGPISTPQSLSLQPDSPSSFPSSFASSGISKKLSPQVPYDFEPYGSAFYENFRDNYEELDHVKNQPYRTTPLVLPGAKAKHEAPTGSYLRYHPNQMVRSSSSHYDYLPQSVAMKQRVADSIFEKIEKDEAMAGKQIIRKQFNTPIGLYSDKNIIDTIHHTTRLNSSLSRTPSSGRVNQSLPPRKAVVFDPAKSEAYKALQEEQYGDGPVQEVMVPVQTKIFTPMKQSPQAYSPATPHGHHHPGHQHHQAPHVNPMGHADDQIAQSGSFKRLMNMVLYDSN